MISEKFESSILIRVLLLLLTLTGTAFFLVKGLLLYTLLLIPVVIYQVINLYEFQIKSYTEISQFVESIHYRDFSRYFDEKHGSLDLKYLRKGFNEINSAFKIISREKETQYQYLQKILELVETGILSYDEETSEVIWMNEALKRMLQLPYVKNIHSLSRRNEELYREIVNLKVGESKIGTVHLDRNTFKILFSATGFQTEGKKYKLIAFQNINEALDETESEAWKKLLSVLTHEIMNSIAPISSLADTLKNRLSAARNEQYSGLEDLELGIDTIKRRSEGLLKFAEIYRSLNKISKPALKKIYIRDLFENLHHLMQPTLLQKKIEVEVILKDPNLVLEADPALLEQVLINLIVNAIEAVKDREEPRIVLSASAVDSKTQIKVADNGAGMPAEVVEKIFVPFFTTKKNGSGIGLTLCKQIMMMHHGNIQVQSIENVGTAFILQL